MKETFTLTNDKYDGVTIDKIETSNINEFEDKLISLIKNLQNKKLLWIKLDIEQSFLIPLLVTFDFTFHNCNPKNITMVKKLIKNPIIPTSANHTLGVGAIVMHDNKLLVIKDKIIQKYKLPGGYIDNQENISEALIREVNEETGVKVKFQSIVSLAHMFPSQFEQSNLYIVCKAKALTTQINIIDTDEIIEAKWMDLDEYFSHKDIFEYNKDIVKNAIQKDGLLLTDYNYSKNLHGNREYYF